MVGENKNSWNFHPIISFIFRIKNNHLFLKFSFFFSQQIYFQLFEWIFLHPVNVTADNYPFSMCDESDKFTSKTMILSGFGR
jgi:hypothetical protein